jgi:hypothetical protein
VKLVIETTSKQTSISVIDEVSPPQQVARAGGKDLRTAVEWIIRRVNRIADQVEDRLVALGLITEAEIEELLSKRPIESEDEIKGQEGT